MDPVLAISGRYRNRTLIAAAVTLVCVTTSAQVKTKALAEGSSSAAERGISLASKGRCKEALPILKKASGEITNKDLKYDVLMSTARCAIGLERTETAVRTLLELSRSFAKDPEVLYLTTHYYSELALKASHELASAAPSSAQAQQLEAEAFESQGEWDKAVTQYQRILDKSAAAWESLPAWKIVLTKTPSDSEDAKKEFEEELKVDPNSAASEFLLGEIARAGRAVGGGHPPLRQGHKLDEGFVESYLALGISMNAAGQFADAVAPLENYVKMQPDDPAGHYQLATAYARTGRKQDAQREMALQQETAAKAPRTSPQQ